MLNNFKLIKVLYISLDGIMQPLGHSQVLKYIEKLSSNYQMNLITFEKSDDYKNIEALTLVKNKCKEKNIYWYQLKYRSGWMGLGQLLNVISIIFVPAYVLPSKNISLVHIRSYMPGIGMPLLMRIFNFKLIFDIRGFWADEKRDRLNWNHKSYKYRFFKALEKYLMQNADFIVALTKSSKAIISNSFSKSKSLIEVIPTCVDSEEFYEIDRTITANEMTIGYLGAVDTAYDFKKFCYLISQIQDNYQGTINLKVFTNKEEQYILNILSDRLAKELNLDIRFVPRHQLAAEISTFDFLGFCIKENYSIEASMPTKIAEALACGTPIVCNGFNADIKELILINEIGLIYNFEESFKHQNLKELINLISTRDISKRCINVAKQHFSLEAGSLKYHQIYSNLLK